MTVPDQASTALPILAQCLGESLVAVYLHGSAVSGGLRPNSDVDLLAIVDAPTTFESRQRLVKELMQISARHPAKPGGPRCLEVMIFERSALASTERPFRGEFVYGEWLRDDFEAGTVPEPVVDPDFTLVLAQARPAAIPLFGPAATELLPAIADADIRQAMLGALPALMDNLRGDERNVLLTLARMWRTLEVGDFVPKDAAAQWAIPRLPADAAAPLNLARAAYLGEQSDDWGPLQRESQRAADLIFERLTTMAPRSAT
jgi:predicted nucleotidyltransferase